MKFCTYRGNVTGKPLPVSLRLLEAEQGLEVVLEGKVQGLGGEVSDDVGSVTSPQGYKAFLLVGSGEAVHDTLVRGSETSLLDPESRQGFVAQKARVNSHLILVLDQELDSLDGGSGSLCNGGRDTSHEEINWGDR